MKIILASGISFVLKYGYNLTGIPKDKMRIGYVTTASKATNTPVSFFENLKNRIREQGYVFEEIDIVGKTKDQLRSFFKDKNIIQVEGGNVFYLLKAIKETGFAEVLKELLNEGKIYIGTSAGAYVMCPSIEVAAWKADEKEKCGVTDFTALNYVPFVLKAHYTEDMATLIKAKIRTLTYSLRVLNDWQGILVENNTCTFVGDGEEVKFK